MRSLVFVCVLATLSTASAADCGDPCVPNPCDVAAGQTCLSQMSYSWSEPCPTASCLMPPGSVPFGNLLVASSDGASPRVSS
eukprot:2991771-Rhodomonas_salina.1